MNNLTKYSWLTTAIILLAGFLLLHFGFVSYSYTFFLIFPFSLGFTFGTLNEKQRTNYTLFLALFSFFGFLLAGRLEGVVCVFLAMPIFILMVYIGYLVQNKVTKKRRSNSNKLLVSISPLLILIFFNHIEQIIIPKPKETIIQTSVYLNYPADLVFDEVKKMDKLDGKKPIGILLGLPAPQQCILEADSIGAKRNCIFKNGKIVAQISKFERGKILEMDVIEYTLTGRDWFEFIDAKYIFQETGNKTKITRTSKYRSILNPRFYWAPLERWGIEQEHTFVLRSLKKNLKEKYGM